MNQLFRFAVITLYLSGLVTVGILGTSTSMTFVWPGYLVIGLSGVLSVVGFSTAAAVVHDRKEKELTIAPWFLLKTKRVAFLATKSDKRRALAWLFYRWGRHDESPSFLRYIPDVEKVMTVFIDNKAMTWACG